MASNTLQISIEVDDKGSLKVQQFGQNAEAAGKAAGRSLETMNQNMAQSAKLIDSQIAAHESAIRIEQEKIAILKQLDSEQIAATIQAEQDKTEILKKLNDEQCESAITAYDKIISKMLEVGETAAKLAGIIATTLLAFEKGSELGGLPGGIAAGSIALAVDLIGVFGAANAEAADLDEKFVKIYNAKQQIILLGITEKAINADINSLIGDQLSSWSKIKENLPDVVKNFLKMEETASAMVGMPDLSLNKTFEDMGAEIDTFISSIEKPESAIEALYENTTDKALRALATQLVNDRNYINANVESHKEAQDAILQLYVKYTLDKQQILAESAQNELKTYQGLLEGLGSTISTNFQSAAMDQVVMMMKDKYSEMLSAEEKSNAAILNSVEVAHEIRLGKEKEFYDKLLKILGDYHQKAFEAQRKASGADINENEQTKALDLLKIFQQKLTASTQLGHDLRVAAIKDEQEQSIFAVMTAVGNAQDQARKIAQINALAHEQLSDENKRMMPDTSKEKAAAEEYQKALEAVTLEYNKLTMVSDDFEKLKIWQEWEKSTAKLTEYALAARDLNLKAIEDKKIGSNLQMVHPVGYNYDQSDYDWEAIKKIVDDRLNLQTDLTDRINKLTLSEHDYKVWALNDEAEKMRVKAGDDMALCNQVTEYQIDKFKQIEASQNSWLSMTKHLATEMERSFSTFFFDTITGKFKSFEDFLTGVMNAIAKMVSDVMASIARKIMFGDIEGQGGNGKIGGLIGSAINGLSGYFSGDTTVSNGGSWAQNNALGGAYSGSGISAYENSIVTHPTYFPFAAGIGLMGEAGAEAIMPLSRTSDGKLGVKAEAGASTQPPQITVNIQNNTGNQIKDPPKIDFNMKGMILSVVLDGYTRDVDGFRTGMGGR